MEPAALWEIEDKRDVDVERVLGARERLSGRLVRAYSLEWKTGASGLDLSPMTAEEAMRAMRATAKDFGPFDPHREERVTEPVYARVAKAVEFMRVTGAADPRRLARRLSM
jgi:hypothetical protein